MRCVLLVAGLLAACGAPPARPPAAPAPIATSSLAWLTGRVGAEPRAALIVDLQRAQGRELVPAVDSMLPMIGGASFATCHVDPAKLLALRVAIGAPLRVAADLDGDIDRARLICAAGERAMAFANALGIEIVDRPGGISISMDALPRPIPLTVVGARLAASCNGAPPCGAFRLGPSRRTLWVIFQSQPGHKQTLTFDGPGYSRPFADALAAALRGNPDVTTKTDADRFTLGLSAEPSPAMAQAIHELVEAFKIPSVSMMPTLDAGDHIFAAKGPLARYAVGDVVVHRNDVGVFIKRIVATGGQTVSTKDGELYIDGARLPTEVVGPAFKFSDVALEGPVEVTLSRQREHLGARTYEIGRRPDGHTPGEGGNGTWTVPAGQYFLIGDNRDYSNDSRYQGPVKPEALIGRAFGIWFAWKDNAPDWDRIGTAIE